MACSALRPNTTATRTLPVLPLIAADPSRARLDGPPCGSLVACRSGRDSFRLRLAGALVHLYTASGTVVGLLIVLAAIEGETLTALWLFFVALFIDGTDGMLARRFRVKETIPWFDGALLDNIVDYLTYVLRTVVLLWTTDSLPTGTSAGWWPRCRCWRRATSSAGSTRSRLDGRRPLLPGLPQLLERRRLLRDRPRRVAAVVAVALVVLSVLVFVPVRYLYRRG